MRALALAIAWGYVWYGVAAIPPSQLDEKATSQPFHHVAVIGAPLSGPLVEGVVGSLQKGERHRFYCQSSLPPPGFLGPGSPTEQLWLKNQPGVFPAPTMEPTSISFCFNCSSTDMPFTPVIVRPDGSVFYGQPMNGKNSPQTVMLSAPAQTGIYTLFILSHQKGVVPARASVQASVSSRPLDAKAFRLKSFDSDDSESDMISAEFIF